MRIATTQFHATMNTALQNANARLEHVMQQMSSGQRLLQPSDDPISNVRLSRMAREDAALTQYRDNISALSTRLMQNETALGSMVQDMLQVRDLLVWARDGSNTSEDVKAMASSLTALRDSLFYSSNSKDQEGRYLFSGTASATDTVTYDDTQPLGARYTFTGNTAPQQVVVGHGITQTANVTLSEMAALLNSLDRTATSLQTTGMNTGDTVGDTIKALDDALSSVSGKIAGLGGTQNILATLDSNHGNVSVSNQQAMITLGQLDYGEAATRLSGYSTALQATQKAYSKVSGLSLFDLL
ncbi:flagellar hook-associated protein 3 [Rhodococcus sp. SRB_17]|nr:flagellar hook-associated protein 3 [Rhodococcus sp. SRB_17]